MIVIYKMEYITQATEKEEFLFKQQKELRDLKLSHEQINFIIQQLDYDLEQNEDIIKNSKDKNERNCCKEENLFIKKLICDLESQEHSQLILQKLISNDKELTAEQEDYILESSLEQMREARK